MIKYLFPLKSNGATKFFFSSLKLGTPIVFIEGIPESSTKEDVLKYFPDFKKYLSQINKIKSSESQPTSKAILTFSTVDQASLFISTYNKKPFQYESFRNILEARPMEITLNLSEPRPSKSESLNIETERERTVDRRCFLLINNIPFYATHKEVMDHFKSLSEHVMAVELSSIPQSQKNRGYANIYFDREDNLNKFLERNKEITFMGRALRFFLKINKL